MKIIPRKIWTFSSSQILVKMVERALHCPICECRSIVRGGDKTSSLNILYVCCTTSRKRKGQQVTMVDTANKLLETTQKCTCLYFLCSYPLFWCALIPPSTYVPIPVALSRNPKKSILWNYEEGKSRKFYSMLYTSIHVTILIYVMPCMKGQ